MLNDSIALIFRSHFLHRLLTVSQQTDSGMDRWTMTNLSRRRWLNSIVQRDIILRKVRFRADLKAY